MPQLIKRVLLCVLVCLLPSVSIAQKAPRKTRKPTPPRIICEIASVPKGMVVVGYKRNSACSDGTELVVKWPENGDIICAGSPVPRQFSIATEAQGRAVGTCRDGAVLIVGASPGAGANRGADTNRAAGANPAAGPSSGLSDSSGPGANPAAGVNPHAAAERRAAQSVADDAIARAFASRASGIQVEGEGAVIRLLPDDLNGTRHQRFIIQLASGQTLLVSHNIDLAPRINGLDVGDSVRFNGEYEWNEKGGVVHWTHRDPRGRHVAGWVMHSGKTYQD